MTPLPPTLLPLAVGTLMYPGDRLAEAKMMTVSLPATPGEDGKGPPSGRPVTGHLDRRVDTPPGHFIIFLHPPPLETPHHSLVALQGLPWRPSEEPHSLQERRVEERPGPHPRAKRNGGLSKKRSHSSTCLTWRAASRPSPASDSRD